MMRTRGAVELGANQPLEAPSALLAACASSLGVRPFRENVLLTFCRAHAAHLQVDDEMIFMQTAEPGPSLPRKGRGNAAAPR